MIDYRTSDVTRACFFSYDAEAYFNPEATTVHLQAYVKNLNFPFKRVLKKTAIAIEFAACAEK